MALVTPFFVESQKMKSRISMSHGGILPLP
jgi:hypothetical protein